MDLAADWFRRLQGIRRGRQDRQIERLVAEGNVVYCDLRDPEVVCQEIEAALGCDEIRLGPLAQD